MSGFTLRALLKGADARESSSVYESWFPGTNAPGRAEVLAELVKAMSDEERVEARLVELPQKLADLMNILLGQSRRSQSISEVAGQARESWPSHFEVEASLVALHREGFLFPVASDEPQRRSDARFAVPVELADCIDQLRRRQEHEIHNTITLKGFLNSRYFDSRQRASDPDDRAEDHARKVYKIYLMESSIHGRVRSLPEQVRKVWDVALSKHGGLMPAEEIPAALGDDAVDLDLVKKCLEEAMLGTVAPLRLARFGIRPSPKTVIAFYEVALICLQERSRSAPVEVQEVVSSGVDLVTNVGRVLREIGASKVQFTVEGRLYKASEKRIIKNLLSIPGEFLNSESQIRLIYRFCLSRRLVDRSGERALRPTESGESFDRMPLMEKLRSLLAYGVEERGVSGEDYHQVRLRRILLRLLKRVEPDEWHELVFIPFLARNNYLSNLEEHRVEELFATRFQAGGYLPSESVQQMCWNLVRFIKRRLYPLGLVDLGLRRGRPVAVRLSRLGAELLGAVPAGELGGSRSEVVVNPDFEIILFPGEDEHEVVHAFDRFAERLKTDVIHHFRLSRATVQAAVKEGMPIARIVQEMTDRSRTPLPQNVLYSLDDWADEAGVMMLEGAQLRARRREQVDRFLALPVVKPFIQKRTSATTVALKQSSSFDDLQQAARDLGFFIERRCT